MSLLLPTALAGQVAGEGTSFVFALPHLTTSLEQAAEQIQLLVSTPSSANITITKMIDGSSFTATVNGYSVITLDTSGIPLPKEQGTFHRAVMIESDAPVTVSAVLDRGTSSEAYGLIPTRDLGYNYVASGLDGFLTEGTFTVIGALVDSTIVTITPSKTTLNGDPPGVPFTVRLDRGDLYQVRSFFREDLLISDNLERTLVSASEKVAVWSGSACSTIDPNDKVCGPLLEQLPPFNQFARTFVIGLLQGESMANIRFYAGCGLTSIVSPDIAPDSVIIENIGGHDKRVSVSPGTITADKGVMAIRFTSATSTLDPRMVDSATGDPSMVLIPGIEQMGSRYRFGVPLLMPRQSDGVFRVWQHYIQVTRPDLMVQASLDGSPLALTGLSTSFPIEPGGHTLVATGPVGLTLYGRGTSDAYSFLPAPVGNPSRLEILDTLNVESCSDRQTVYLRVRNSGNHQIVLDRAEFIPARRDLPLVPGSHQFDGQVLDPGEEITFSFLLGNISGTADVQKGRVFVYTQGCPGFMESVPLSIRRLNRFSITPARRETVTFPTILVPAMTSDVTVKLRNDGIRAITFLQPAITPSIYSVVSPGFPLTLAPGEEREVTLRYTREDDDVRRTGTLRFVTEECPADSTNELNLQSFVQRFQSISPAAATTGCDPKELDTLVGRVVVRSDLPVQIDSVVLTEDADGEYRLINASGGVGTYGPGDTIEVRILYTPGVRGERKGNVRLYGSGFGFEPVDLPLVRRHETIDWDVDRNEIDFGTGLCDTVPDEIVRVVNHGSLKLDKLWIRLEHGANFWMSLSNTTGVRTGDTLLITIRPDVAPGFAAFDTLVIFEEVCGKEIRIPVRIRCEAEAAFTISAPATTGDIGSTIDLPIELQSDPESLALGQPATLYVTAQMRGDILLPVGISSVASDRFNASITSDMMIGTTRRLELRGVGVLPESGPVMTLSVLALLGSDSVSPVQLQDFRLEFESNLLRSTYTTVDGSVSLRGWCPIGSPRFVDATGTFGLKIRPEPSSGSIEIEMGLVEDGWTTLELYDITGRLVTTILSGAPGRGEWHLSHSTELIPRGEYYLRLTTPTEQVTLPVIVVR